jgi:hypothetical protein
MYNNRYNNPKLGQVFSNLRKAVPHFRVCTFEHVPDGALFLPCDITFSGNTSTTLDHVPRGNALRRVLHRSHASLSAQTSDVFVCVYRKAGQAGEFVRGYGDGVCVDDVACARQRDHIFHLDTPCVFVEV